MAASIALHRPIPVICKGTKEEMQTLFDTLLEAGYRVESSINGGQSIRMSRYVKGVGHRVELNVE